MKTILGNIFVAICIILFCSASHAERYASKVDLSSPRRALQTYLQNLDDNSYHPAVAAQIFPISNKSQAEKLAIKLKQILDGQGIYFELEEVPDKPNYIDSLSNKARYILSDRYPKIFLIASEGRWMFSSTTVKSIPEIHKKVFPMGTNKLLNLVPRQGTTKILGLYLWQYFGLLFLIFVGFFTHKVLTFFFRKILGRIFKRYQKAEIVEDYLYPVARPLSMLAVTFLYLIFTPVLQLSANMSYYVVMFFKILTVILAIRVVYKLIDFFSYQTAKIASKTESTLDDQLIPLIRKTLKTFIFIIGVLIALDTLRIPIIPLLTGLSLGGLAFALAAQDTIKNFFGSIMIFIDRPFQVGDWITSGNIDGTVEEVGLRATRIRTFRNSVVYVPNGKLADTDIDNHGLRNYRRFSTKIGITYDTPPSKVAAFVEGLKGIVLNHPNTNKDNFHVYLNEFGGSSLNIMFYIFFKVPDWGNELASKHEIMLQIMQLADTIGVRFAFPSQTLYVEEVPGQASLTPNHEDDQKTLREKVDGFVGSLK